MIGYDGESKVFYPISMTKNEGPVMTVLQIADADRTHYVFVQNLDVLLRPSNSKNSTIVYCPRLVINFSCVSTVKILFFSGVLVIFMVKGCYLYTLEGVKNLILYEWSSQRKILFGLKTTRK